MIDVFFWLFFIATPIIAFLLLKEAKIDPFQISIPSLFFWTYLFFSYLGLPILFYGMDRHRLVIGVTDPDIVFHLFLFASLCLLGTCVGAVCCSRIETFKIPQLPPLNVKLGYGSLIMIFLIFMMVLIMTGLYIRFIPGLPIMAAMRGDVAQIKVLRSLATNSYGGPGKYYYYSTFFSTILPFILYILIAHSVVSAHRFSLIFTGLVFFTALFLSIMQSQKAPAAWLIIGCYLTHLHAKASSIKLKSFIPCCLVIMLSLSFMYVFFMGMQFQDLHSIFSAILERVLTGNLTPAYFYLSLFPEQHPYLAGRSFPNPRNIFPWSQYPITLHVSSYMFPDQASQGIIGSAPTVYWAEVYANFGPIAPLITAIILGFFLYFLQAILIKIPAHPVQSALIVWSALHFRKLATSPLSSYLLDTNFLAVLLVAALLLIIDRKMYCSQPQRGTFENE